MQLKIFAFSSFQFILSQQKGRVDHLNDVHSLSKIINVAAFKDGVIIQGPVL